MYLSTPVGFAGSIPDALLYFICFTYLSTNASLYLHKVCICLHMAGARRKLGSVQIIPTVERAKGTIMKTCRVDVFN